MPLRTLSKWVWISFILALGGGILTLACGDDPPLLSDPSPTPKISLPRPTPTSAPTPQSYIPNPNYTPAVYPTTPPPAPPADAVSSNPSCGPRTGHIFFGDIGDVIPDLLRWTQDGTDIILDQPRGNPLSGRGDPTDGSNIYLVDAGGTRLRMIVDANPGYVSLHGTYADVSPDGTQVVYASCEYPTGPEVFTTTAEYRYYGAGYHHVWDRERYNYEIVTRKIDGTDPRRLTENVGVDHFPVWSPDGSRIAFVGNGRLSTIAPDGSGLRDDIGPRHIALSPPAWSPDGGSLAFFARGHAYTVGEDGSNLTRLSDMVLESPVWSPDGGLVAFARSGEDISDIVISSPDGSDQRAIAGLRGISLWTSDGSDVRFGAIPESTDSGEQMVTADLVATSIAWSPDGSEVRFVGSLASMESGDGAPAYAGIFSVGIDGTDMRIIAEIEWPSLVSWSPDGSRIAVRIMLETIFSSDPDFGVVLYTLSSNGSDKRILVRRTPSEKLAAESEWKNVGVCSDGYVVPDPQDNPGLVRDCEALLRIRDVLAGDAAMNWSFDVPITEWQGLVFHPSYPSTSFPLRVRGLNYQDYRYPRLTGILPAELGDLEELEVVFITHQSLAGEIPSELGNLSKLRALDLSNNGLAGEIPSELGNLRNLRGLVLSNNDLMGNIPLELGGISKYLNIYVDGNSGLTGRVPSEVWHSVNSIHVQGTSLMPPMGESVY